MAKLNLQEVDVPVAFRRQTRDLKDVQEALKTVVESGGQFVERHISINEEDKEEPPQFSPPILKLKPQSIPPPKKPASHSISAPDIMISEPPPPLQEKVLSRPLSPPYDHIEAIDGGGEVNVSSKKPHQHHHSDRPVPQYGEIVVLGTNGSLGCNPISPKMSNRFILKKQPKATGVSLILNQKENEDIGRKSTHTVSMTLAKNKSCVMKYGPDSSVDMFQIGRSVDSAIDLVVMDTIDNPNGTRSFNSNSTVSRYSCRIVCERVPPYTARIYAAAFDTKGRIQLSPMAPTWVDVNGDSDGLTTNGVAVLRPVGSFVSGVEPGEWLEVTVMGNMRKRRVERSSRIPNTSLPEETNMLTDGCLIDLCGVTLMWRSAIGLDQGLSSTLLRERTSALNKMAPQCPVNLLTLHFRDGGLVPHSIDEEDTSEDKMREPWVYQECGHVFGQHQWKDVSNSDDNRVRTCPICRKTGAYIRLQLAQEKAFFVDDGLLTHAFVPCGHVTTHQTAKYWSKVSHPRLSSSWSLHCPFCLTKLDNEKSHVKLLFN